MLKLSTLLLALGLFTLNARAEYVGGVILGANFTKLTNTGSTDSASHLLVGAYGQWSLKNNFYIEPQLRYNNKGGTVPALINGSIINANISLKYLELPIYAKYKIPTTITLVPYVFAGPELAVRIGSSSSASASFAELKAFELGLGFGAGAEYPVQEDITASISGSYSLGLTDVNAGNSKNRGLQLYAGLGMRF